MRKAEDSARASIAKATGDTSEAEEQAYQDFLDGDEAKATTKQPPTDGA